MKSLEYTYNDFHIEFIKKENNVMVNATQMAKAFNKRIDRFLRTDNTKTFIKELEFTLFGGNSEYTGRDEIIKTKGKSGTYMHRVLALKFAAWLSPKFEIWVFSIIDKILYSHFKEIKDATLEKLRLEAESKQIRNELLQKNPDGFSKFLELEGKMTKADRKRIKAIRASAQELRLNLFDNY
jgi:phage regulator Rha-like protein